MPSRRVATALVLAVPGLLVATGAPALAGPAAPPELRRSSPPTASAAPVQGAGTGPARSLSAEPPGRAAPPEPLTPPLWGTGRYPAASSDFGEPALLAPAAPPGGHLETDRRSRPVAPGTTLASFDRVDPLGWLRGDLLRVRLGGAVRADYLSPGRVAAVEPLSRQADRAGAIGGVNGDFFDINNTGAARGAAVDDQALVKSAIPGWPTTTAGVDVRGLGRIAQVLLEGQVRLPDGRTVPLDQLNAHFVKPGGLGAFTSLWGTAARSRVADDGAQRVAEALVRDGRVVSVSDTLGSGEIPADGFVLVGREAGGDLLRTLAPGDPLSITYRPRTDGGPDLDFAVGGNQTLVSGGQIPDLPDPAAHPRTAVGFSADARTMFLLTVDGRQLDSRGVTLRELAEMMREAGAYNALNLDGGGSATLLAREPGGARGQVENQPSDGAERPTPNGIGLFAPPGGGRLDGFWVETAIDPAGAPGAGPVPGGRPDRLFPGLTRRLTAKGYDATYGPARGEPRWSAYGSAVRVGGDGVARGRHPGGATVAAAAGGARGEVDLTVLGELTRVGTTAERVTLPDGAATGRFGVVGYDAEGFTAPVEPADARLDYDTGLLDITPAADGGYQVKARGPAGSTLVTVEVAGHRTALPVSVGLDGRIVGDLDDGAQWRFGGARATGTVEPVAAGHTGPGLRLTYDFTQSTATRAAYAYPPRPIRIDGRAQALGAWVYGHGRGEWTAFTVTDQAGQTFSLYGPYVTWQGWRYVEAPVPASAVHPIQIDRFYTVETGAGRQYTGEVVIDDITAKVPPAAPVPPPVPPVTDPVVVGDGTVAGRPWRFAVLSGTRFAAADPGSAYVARARRTLREILAARPDFLVVDGDLVGTGYEADFALAERVLDEEIGGRLPYHYVPGEHEISGTGSTDNFRAVFGSPFRTFDHKGTRFVLLDSSAGSYHASAFAQLPMLRAALDAARKDRAVRSVVVLAHHPPRDPLPAGDNRLGDRKEAALVERWLGEFEAATGKEAAYVGAHAGVFAAGRVDGVPYVLTGNAGAPPGTGRGGFTGWTMFGVGRTAGAAGWLAAENRPHVDALRLDAPESVPVGGSGRVRVTVEQNGGTVPLEYPMSADWSASPGVHVGDPADARPWHVAALDPRDGSLHAFRTGDITVAVTVNGVSQRAPVRLVRAAG